jgi:VanZ family protein
MKKKVILLSTILLFAMGSCLLFLPYLADTYLFPKIIKSLPFAEKIHIAVFSMFGFLSQMIFEQKLVAFFCIIVSGLDELFQHFLVIRVGDWRDGWLNLFSAAFGMFLAFLLFKSNSQQTDEEAD